MKTLLLVLLLLLKVNVLDAPSQIHTILLPEIVFEGKTYQTEIFETALELGADSLTAHIIVAQARVESGDFSNRLTRDHNNVFSMQHPRIRKTTSLGPLASAEKRKNKYASYTSVRESVVDLFLYFEARKIDKTQPSIRSYVKRLKRKSFFEEAEVKYYTAVKNKFKPV